MSNTITLSISGVDPDLLERQRLALVRMIVTRSNSDGDLALAEGLINMLDQWSDDRLRVIYTRQTTGMLSDSKSQTFNLIQQEGFFTAEFVCNESGGSDAAYDLVPLLEDAESDDHAIIIAKAWLNRVELGYGDLSPFEASACVVITHNEHEYEETPVRLSVEGGRVRAEPLDAHYGLLEFPEGDNLADTINALLSKGSLSGRVATSGAYDNGKPRIIPFYVKFTA